MAVLSKDIYSPQNFLEVITGECYIIGDHPIEFIHNILINDGIENDTDNTVWDYPLDDISEIVSNNINVVLIDVSGFNSNDEWITEYRWFEVPLLHQHKFIKEKEPH